MSSVKLSKGNTKMGGILNIAMRPIKDCANCDACKRDCYALKAWKQYKETRKAWTHNSELFRADPWAAVRDIHGQLERKRVLPRFFRIHVAGDFLSQDHADAWMWLAAQWKDIAFLAFTKRHDLRYGKRPANMAILFSMWPGMEKPRKQRGIRFAWMQDGTETRIPKTAIKCAGSCEDCGMCWDPTLGRDVCFFKH